MLQVTVFGAWLDDFFFRTSGMRRRVGEVRRIMLPIFSLLWNLGLWKSMNFKTIMAMLYDKLFFYWWRFIKINKEFLDLELFHCNVHYKFISTRTSAIWVAGQFHMESSSLEMDQCTFVMRPCTHFLTIALVFLFTRYLYTEDMNKWSYFEHYNYISNDKSLSLFSLQLLHKLKYEIDAFKANSDRYIFVFSFSYLTLSVFL